MLKHCKPIFIENSKIPILLSYISPINIWAINIVFFVFCRGELSEETKRHETIHYQQWLELFVIGFAILYPLYWIINIVKRMSPEDAYYNIPFEIEAFKNQSNENYLEERSRYSWFKDR